MLSVLKRSKLLLLVALALALMTMRRALHVGFAVCFGAAFTCQPATNELLMSS